MPFDRFVAAIDQNILNLTEEFVTRVILGRSNGPAGCRSVATQALIVELDDDPTSYAMKEQLIYMLPDINAVSVSDVFGAVLSARYAKRRRGRYRVGMLSCSVTLASIASRPMDESEKVTPSSERDQKASRRVRAIRRLRRFPAISVCVPFRLGKETRPQQYSCTSIGRSRSWR